MEYSMNISYYNVLNEYQLLIVLIHTKLTLIIVSIEGQSKTA